ncbi:MAG: AraC family ligand binding domain-containing protein, partial [Solirubrobacteraceae bacterium]
MSGIEALHARFVEHVYRPHSHPTWTVAVVQRGAARFSLDATQQRAGQGELFVLEPEAVHTVAAVSQISNSYT